MRAGNPECFHADGTFKRGHRPRNQSAAYRATGARILRMQEHIAAARLDFYHNAANSLLARYDNIGIGAWRPKSAPGLGKARRAQRRKDYDHAISSFAAILKYKAGADKKVFEAVPEHGTTRDCVACGASTGPAGLAGLGVREWVCTACGGEPLGRPAKIPLL